MSQEVQRIVQQPSTVPEPRVSTRVKDTWRSWIQREATLYVAVGLVLALVAIRAFWRSGYIAGGDFWPGTAMPHNQVLTQDLQLWGTSTTGFGSPQYNPTGVFWGVFQSVFLRLGIPGPHVEFLTLAVPFVAEGLAIIWLARTLFPSQRLVALAGGLALPLSLYSALTVTNYDWTFAMAYFAGSAAWIWRRAQHPVAWWLWAIEIGIASLGLMVLVSPPPLAVWTLAWMLLWGLVGAFHFRQGRKLWGGALGGGVLALGLNAWWLYAAHLTLYGSGSSVQQTFVNPFQWGWVDQRASLVNLLSMQGFWSWPQVIYYRWAVVMGHGVLHWSLYLPTFLALVGLLWHSAYRFEKGILTLVAGISLWVAQGLHAPLGDINAWLYLHVPFYWLLRDPQVEADITLYLALILLAGVGVEVLVRAAVIGVKAIKPAVCGVPGGRLWNWVRRPPTWEDDAVRAGTALLMTGALTLGGYALYTGQIIPARTLNGAASPVVHVPSYWMRLAGYLNRRAGYQKILLLPNDDFYQMPYRWGYYGTDAVAATFLRNPVFVLDPGPGGYLGPSGANDAFQQQLETALSTPGNHHLVPLLRALNIGWIVERGDIVWNFPERRILSPTTIHTALTAEPGLRLARRFGPLTVYRVGPPGTPVQEYTAAGRWLSGSAPPLVTVAEVTHEGIPWVPRGLKHPRTGPEGLGMGASVLLPPAVTLPKAGMLVVVPKTVAITARWVTPGRVNVGLQGPTIMIGDTRFQWQQSVTLTAPLPHRGRWAVQVGSLMFTAPNRPMRVGVSVLLGTWSVPGDGSRVTEPVELWESPGANMLAGKAWSPVGDCNAYNRATLRQAGISAHRFSVTGVVLKARTHAACVADGTILYGSAGVADALVQVEGQYQAEVPPQMQVVWNGQSVGTVVGSATKGWQTLQQWIPIEGSGTLQVFTYAYGQNNGRATVDAYQSPAVWVFRPMGGGFLSIQPHRYRTPSGVMRVRYASPPSSNLIHDANFRHGLWSVPFNADAALPLTNAQAGLVAQPLSGHMGGISLAARFDGVGEAQTINGIAGATLQLSLQARAVQGSPPTVVLLDPHNQALWSSSFAATGTPQWQTARATIHVPASVSRATLILYAYGNGVQTVDQYRDLRLIQWPAGPAQLTWIGLGAGSHLIPNAIKPEGPMSYRVALSSKARLVVLDESYSSGWGIFTDRGREVRWRHVLVDGWLNGWIVPGSQRGLYLLEYEPWNLYRRLQWIALAIMVGLATLGGVLLLQRLRPKRGRVATASG
ncbi:MAG: hypothetical protein OWU33_13625 [Firmicutes bacterium]|nr:hypothetical protein [Bacillota bacterium]